MDLDSVEAIYPLSPLQEAMLSPGHPAGGAEKACGQWVCPLRRELDLSRLRWAWQQVGDRHPVLRTSFVWQRLDRPVQVVRKQLKLGLELQDWQGLASDEQDERLKKILHGEREQGFDPATPPLVRLTLCQTDDETFQLVGCYHPLVLDRESLSLILQELFAFYDGNGAGEALLLSRRPSYRDYLETLKGQEPCDAERYWREALAGFTAPTPLRVDRSEEALLEDERGYEEQHLRLSSEVTTQLEELAEKYRCSLSTLVQGAWALLLSQYSGEEDVLFGTTISDRPRELEGAAAMVGPFSNALPLRVRVSPEMAILAWLQALDAQLERQRRYGAIPLAQIQAWSDVPLELPLFFSRVVMDPRPDEGPLGHGGEPVGVGPLKSWEAADVPLILTVVSGQEVVLQIGYQSQRFSPATITRMLGHLQRVLGGIVADPEGPVGTVPLLTEAEQHQLLVEWNSTQTEYPREQCIQQLFEAQVARTPDAVAVIYEQEQFTYRELNTRANRLGHYLQGLGVGPEVRVGLCVQRSLEMLVGVLGILKAGGAYVPLDPSYPLERLAFMIEDAQLPVLLTQEQLMDELPAHWGQVVCLDADWEEISCESEADLEGAATPESLAYVIYTSGSTGRPKGVLVTHQNLVHSTTARLNHYSQPVSEFLLLPSFAFDSSAAGIFWTLCQGGTLLLPSDRRQEDIFELLDWMRQHSVSHWLSVPSLYGLLLTHARPGDLDSLRTVIVAGESCPRLLTERHWERLPKAAFFNEYGPTEATVWSTVYESGREPAETVVPIGRPIANTQVYLLDARLRPVPIGVPGELCIGGDGLARGYLNSLELTESKFIVDPFSGLPGARLYRTGDLARYRPDGNLEFLGRLDDQVKVRGFRIELGEIEAVLDQHSAVRQAVVVVREDEPGDKRLVAYVVPEQGQEITTSELHRFVKAKLPDYTVPAAFMLLEALPLTPNGKVDRRALPVPDAARPELDVSLLAPRTPVEEVLAGVWTQVLGVQQLGIHDNFFELGGHSLLATQIIARIRELFQVDLPLRSLFEEPTVAGLVGWIEAAQRGEMGVQAPPIRPVPPDQPLPLSFAQQRLWFLDQLEPGSCLYNVPSSIRMSGALHVEALQQSLAALVARHEVLRTTFTSREGTPLQVIAPEAALELPVIDLTSLPAEEREATARRLAAEEARRPFDLAQGPLLRASLLRLEAAEHVLLLTLHHIVSDGWSVGVLHSEIAAIYEAFAQGQPSPLAELPIQYGDYAVWQREWLQGEVLEEQLAYWQQQLSGAPPVLTLPTDRPRPAVPSYEGGVESFRIAPRVSEDLQALSQREGVTLFMTLLAAFQTLLHRYVGQEDIVVGTDVANRNQVETEGLIGFFLNHLVLRTSMQGDPTFRELLGRVREVALGAYAHQEVPFEKLVEKLQPERSFHSPLFQVLFVLQNAPWSELELPGLKLRDLGIEHQTSKFDLALFMEETEQGIAGAWVYKTALFDPATIRRMTGHLESLVASIVAQPDTPLHSLEMLTETEREQQMMDERERQEVQISKLRSVRRKTVDLTEMKAVKTGYLPSGDTLPLVIQPGGLPIDLAEWAKGNREFLETELLTHGAILFRGFPVDSVAGFEHFATALCPELFGEYGDLPRAGVSGNIYTSTPYPADKAILFHNESSHLHQWPLRIWFFCVTAAQQGGETPIVDCRKVYTRLDPQLRERFAQKKLMYVRNYSDELDVNWQKFFQTTDRAEVEAYCRDASIDIEWKSGNALRTRQVRQAVARHPRTGEWTFFNQIQLHHVSCLETGVRESLLSMFQEEDLPRHVYYGDGSPIEDSVMEEIGQIYQQSSVSFPWQAGDILMLDNMLTAHGRNPFVGPRKIVVAMGEMIGTDGK
jgi:amino acid adenylation domain-containing protein